jgi:hypothetical protein
MKKPSAVPISSYALRSFRDGDAVQVNELALGAFDQFRLRYSDWPAMASAIGRMSVLADTGEIIVAERDERIIGAVAYSGTTKGRLLRSVVADHSDARPRSHLPRQRRWACPTEECMNRARRDGSRVIALHTSPIMAVALPMYLRMGFRLVQDAPPIYGVPHAVYLKHLGD